MTGFFVQQPEPVCHQILDNILALSVLRFYMLRFHYCGFGYLFWLTSALFGPFSLFFWNPPPCQINTRRQRIHFYHSMIVPSVLASIKWNWLHLEVGVHPLFSSQATISLLEMTPTDRFIQYTGTGEVSFSRVATLGNCNTLSLYQRWLEVESSVEFYR